jgi:hypothetical protein
VYNASKRAQTLIDNSGGENAGELFKDLIDTEKNE